jgi:hypothetical protein
MSFYLGPCNGFDKEGTSSNIEQITGKSATEIMAMIRQAFRKESMSCEPYTGGRGGGECHARFRED